jgi:nicotinate-nucleotide pyrophosphorylase (carboxylating)
MSLTPHQEREIRTILFHGLEEDVASGDVTSLSTIDDEWQAVAEFKIKQNGVLSGVHVLNLLFPMVHPSLSVVWKKKDGDIVKIGDIAGTVNGPARALLQAERLALNILQRMSGIATATRAMVDAAKAGGVVNHAQILDTRKTAPGLRVLDKLAVLSGGGVNHRIGLYDMILVKDNHIDACGGVEEALRKVGEFNKKYESKHRKKLEVEIEARTLDEVSTILRLGGADRILLDNMVKVTKDGIDTSMLERALALIKGKIKTEASGNVTLGTVGAIARTGVDYISSGALTHSVEALDISLKVSKMFRKSKL